MKKILLIAMLAAFCGFARADEGMWLPIFLNYNEAEMQQLGFRLTAEDVYSVNHHSMKDAIVLFGSGCTAELISPKGLLLTNHHCGYSYVQSHSTLEHNYLQDGFWAKDLSEEIPNPGLTVTFLVYMQDVTQQVLQGVTDTMNEATRLQKISENSKLVRDEAVKGTHYEASIKAFYYGNQYFMFVTETYRDIRLVGVPPESIGKFGGDSDNWIWPRHTGDFSLYRIYADKDGEPADYSAENVPFVPKQYFPISIKGIDENDFTLVFGYPGHTRQFVISDEVKTVLEVEDPIAVHARTIRLDAMKRRMDADPAIRLMYAAKANSISNGWKKWQGEMKGLRECHVIAKKEAEEAEFTKWANDNKDRATQYGKLLPEMKDLYKGIYRQTKDITYLGECVFGSEIMLRIVNPYMQLLFLKATNKEDYDDFKKGRERLISYNEKFRKTYCPAIDKECFVELMTYYFTTQDISLIPEELRHFAGNEEEVRTRMTGIWDRSAVTAPYFTDKEKHIEFLKSATPKKVMKAKNNGMLAIAVKLFSQYIKTYDALDAHKARLEAHYRQYVKALMEKDTDEVFYPDANLTMRVTYGQVKGFEPKDAVHYTHYTTLDGIIQKEDTTVYDYHVDPRLKQLWANRDYGRYANAKGELPVAFIASNHTTGGNSGSPVINGDGQLIGVNFDRVWEGTMSDIYYDVNRCRNISLDVRYFLFIVDKFANAQNIIRELTIVE